MSPRAGAVSGKVAAIQGRNRSRRAAASSTKAGSTPEAASPRALSTAGFHHVRGSSRASRDSTGSDAPLDPYCIGGSVVGSISSVSMAPSWRGMLSQATDRAQPPNSRYCAANRTGALGAPKPS